MPPVEPLVMTPVVTASPDDVIGQMLLGTPVSADTPAPAPAAPPQQPAARPQQPVPHSPAAAPPASATAPQPARPPLKPAAPATRPAAPAARPAANAADADVQQERKLKDLLAAPVKASGAAPAAAAPRRATATTQPAHQQSEPPPAPASAPVVTRRAKAPEIPVVCKLCGTRMYAKLEQVGTLVRCPDCHSENVVEAQAPAAEARAPAASDGGDDFALSDPGDRPAYRPMVEARGEYAALKYLDPSAPPRRPDTAPQQQPRGLSTDMTMTLSQSPSEEEDDDGGGEVVLSAPVERIDVKEVVKLPEPDDPDEDNQFRGRFRDEEWGFLGDPRQKDAWKKSPFYFGILSFPFYPQTALRLVLYSFFLTIDLAAILGAVVCSIGETPLLFGALGLSLFASGLSMLLLGGSLPCLVAIAQDTANGCDSVENWPDWNFVEWLYTALMIPAAAILAALPGSLGGMVLLALGKPGFLYSPYTLLVSELMFFPIIFGSMLAEGSFIPMSGSLVNSFQRRGEGWLLFYCLSMLLAIPLAGAIALVQVGVQTPTILVAPFAAVLWVLSLILYFRLLGRLLWYVQNYRRQRDPVD